MSFKDELDKILDKLIENYIERDGSFGLAQLTTNKHWEEVRKTATQSQSTKSKGDK